MKKNLHTAAMADILKAMGNYYRCQILNELLSGEKNVSTLNTVVFVSQPALSQHLSKLRRQGIVGARREQRQIFYYIIEPDVIRLLGMVGETATRRLAQNAVKKVA